MQAEAGAITGSKLCVKPISSFLAIRVALATGVRSYGATELAESRLVKKLKRFTVRELGESTWPLVITWRRLSDSLNGL